MTISQSPDSPTPSTSEAAAPTTLTAETRQTMSATTVATNRTSEDERSDSTTSAPASDPDYYNTSDADEKRDSHKGYQADSSECSD